MSNLYVNTIWPYDGDTVSLSGSLRVSGSIFLGDTNTDAIKVNADFSSSLIPDIPDTFDLGTGEKTWKRLHGNYLNVVSISGSGDLLMTGSISGSSLQTTGDISCSGTVYANSWNITSSSLQVVHLTASSGEPGGGPGNILARGYVSASSIYGNHVTSSGHVSASDTVYGVSGSFLRLNIINGAVSASGNISTVEGTGSFANLQVSSHTSMSGNTSVVGNLNCDATASISQLHATYNVAKLENDAAIVIGAVGNITPTGSVYLPDTIISLDASNNTNDVQFGLPDCIDHPGLRYTLVCNATAGTGVGVTITSTVASQIYGTFICTDATEAADEVTNMVFADTKFTKGTSVDMFSDGVLWRVVASCGAGCVVADVSSS
jgi:hypothetical protein